MGLAEDRRSLAELTRVARVKHVKTPATAMLGEEMITFFKHSVARRQTKLGKIGECWAALVPEALISHSALESFHRGTLVVLVDTASHLYELKQLLLAGLQEQLLIAAKSTGMRKITLKPGRWYDSTSDQQRPRW
jgi:hypothetical protein